jgi:hypothetical protein
MSLGSHIVNLFSRYRVEREIEAELQSHLALRIEDSIAAGMSPDAARPDAVLQFGNPTVVKERVGMVDMALFLENIASDIQRAVRQLRKSSVCSSAVRAHIGAHLLKSQPFSVKPADPKATVLAIAVLGATSLIAAYVPARRAASILCVH